MGWQHTKILAVTTSLPARKFGGFGKTSILILNPAGQTNERQQVNELVEGRGVTAQNNVFAVFLCAGTPYGFSWLPGNKNKREMDRVGIPTPFSDIMGGGKMHTSSPPVITPNRSQSNPDDMITLPRPIQSAGMGLHDVSGTSTGQTLPRERRAPPSTHFVRQFGGYTHILLLFLSSTHYCPLFHPLLSEISSSSCKDLAPGSAGSKTPGVVTIYGWSAAGRRPTPGLQLQGSCARVRRIQNARRRNHLRMVRGGAQTHTRSAAATARILRPGPQDPNFRRRNHLRMVRGGAQTHTRSAAVTDV